MKRSLALAAAILFCAEPAFAIGGDVIPPRSATELEIEAGRLVYMMQQAHDVAKQMPNSPIPVIDIRAAADADGHAAVFRSLVTAVLDFNRLEWQLCGDARDATFSCQGLYLPTWLNGKVSDFSDAQLRAMTDETSGRLMPFWNAVCAQAQKPDTADPVCPIE